MRASDIFPFNPLAILTNGEHGFRAGDYKPTPRTYRAWAVFGDGATDAMLWEAGNQLCAASDRFYEMGRNRAGLEAEMEAEVLDDQLLNLAGRTVASGLFPRALSPAQAKLCNRFFGVDALA